MIKALGVAPLRPTKSITLQNEWKLQVGMAKAADHFSVSRHVIKPRQRQAR